MKNFCVQFCKALKRLRECAGKGQIAFAKDLGLSQPVYARYEKGDREPTLNELIRIANVLNTTPNDLLGFAPLRVSAPPRENTARRGTSAAPHIETGDNSAVAVGPNSIAIGSGGGSSSSSSTNKNKKKKANCHEKTTNY